MKILLVAATRAEIAPLLSRFELAEKPGKLNINNTIVDVLITGVGMVALAYALGRHLASNQYQLALNAGIAGSFDFTIAMGEVILVTEDIFAEQGAEDGEEFIPLPDLGFGENAHTAFAHPESYEDLQSVNPQALNTLRQVKAITVNKVHGHELSISRTLSRVNAQVESMEGAAFFYACKQSKTPCLQIRAISNYVERRNKEKWNISLAVRNLNETIEALLTR